MDKEELEKGMSEAKKDSGGEQKWQPDVDWILESVGPFFSNNRGIGELLLDNLNESGVDTQGEALKSIVKVLKEFSREYKELGEVLGNNISKIDDLSDQSDDLAKAIEDLLKDMGQDSDGGPEIGLDGGAVPPPDGSPPDAGGDMGGGMPPDMGGGMPPDTGGGMPPATDPNLVSDEGVKDVKKYVLSDGQLKNIAGRLEGAYRRRREASRNTRLSPNIVGACKRSDL